MTGTQSIIAGVGVKIYLSQIVGSDKHEKRIFGKVQIFILDKPIMLDKPIVSDQIMKVKSVTCIEKTGNGIYIIETIDKFYFEVGYLKD
jgi:hypothetical protein